VLDMFCYSGGFSVAAAVTGRAASVLAVDSSATAAKEPGRLGTGRFALSVIHGGHVSLRARAGRPSADSQSVDARRGGPDAGSPRCHVHLPRRTAGRSTSQRSLSTGLTAARGPQRGRPGDGASPGRLPARADKLVQSLPQAVGGLPVGGRPQGRPPTPGVHAVTFHCLGEQPGGAPRRGRSRPAAP
jgi:hypothetical protein